MSTYSRLMLDFLPTASDAECMVFVCTSNFDANKEVLQWMVSQAQCPGSVALATYWYMDPDFFSSYTADTIDEWARDDFNMMRLIESNSESGFYKSSKIGFDPRADPIADEDWVDEHAAEGNDNIPAHMFLPIPGQLLTNEDIPEGWDNGMPPHIVEAVWKELDEE
ncbi:DUF4274 domain-containing protein [Deinococcus puniceus]|uniref:DUF4274 domain-containing protein n=1 Tax=Deinococcus puniceus TaxID=1182568 RepID=A0A172T7L2_9DEIO|nr:DUF4274 domain-containing protein [Deinococcus puniceus]ANE42970.1 hypothetical protein SU48_03390 [Deinococcus puniceus]